jgi:acyl carrier protein
MGLEIVEIVLAVESEYGISISDEAAARLETVGSLQEEILQQGRYQGRNFGRDHVWQWLVGLLHEDYGIPVVQITPQARFVKDLGLG